MPRYDYQCTAGHVRESTEDRETSSVACSACGGVARRIVVPGHAPGVNGFTQKPTREHYVPLGRALEAQHEIVHQAERAGIQAPDLWSEAKRRVRRGDVQAIA